MNKEFKIASKIISHVPISYFLIEVILIILLLTAITLPADVCLNPSDKFYFGYYEILRMLFIMFMFLICFRLKLCAYNWVSNTGSFLLSVKNLIAIFTPMKLIVYYAMEINVVFCSIAILSIILYIIDIRNPKTKKDDT